MLPVQKPALAFISLCLVIPCILSIPVSSSAQNSKTPASPTSDTQLEKTASRVVNGEPVTDKTEYPFVVDLSFHDVAVSSSRFCTATLVAPDIILTAAHCVLNDGYRTAVYATVGRIELDDNHKENDKAQTFRAIASLVHPQYQGLASPNDVALMLLNGSSNAHTVHLADHPPTTGDVAWVVGYGIQQLGTVETASRPVEIMSGRLQKTALRIEDKDFCSNPDIEVAPGMLCTSGVKEGSSACKGDSGGGLVMKTKSHVLDMKQEADKAPAITQVGIVSYGDSQCRSEESGVFTDVASVKPWILSAMQRLHDAFNPAGNDLESTTTREINYPGAANRTVKKLMGHVDPAIKYYDLDRKSSHERIATMI